MMATSEGNEIVFLQCHQPISIIDVILFPEVLKWLLM